MFQSPFHEKTTEEEEEREEPTKDKTETFFVLQCKNCRNIVGDSFGFETAHKEFDLVCLSKVINISSIESEPILSKEGIDIGR
jgi:hypothetical protein